MKSELTSDHGNLIEFWRALETRRGRIKSVLILFRHGTKNWLPFVLPQRQLLRWTDSYNHHGLPSCPASGASKASWPQYPRVYNTKKYYNERTQYWHCCRNPLQRRKLATLSRTDAIGPRECVGIQRPISLWGSRGQSAQKNLSTSFDCLWPIQYSQLCIE